MDVLIRKEHPSDYNRVHDVIERAFEGDLHSDHTEHELVARLRTSTAFIDELSLVSSYNNLIIGHILLSKVWLQNNTATYEILSLAPVSVLPEYQGKGIGTQLIETAHEKAVSLGFDSIVLIGHEGFYPRFGYQEASNFNIKFPFDAPNVNCMALELITGSLSGKSGMIVYPKEFA